MNSDRLAGARTVADAVLYEGYVLYPYRASSRKNQARFQFGVLAPQTYAQQSDTESWKMRAEYVLETGPHPPRLQVHVRCLQIQSRSVEKVAGAGEFRTVAELEIGGRLVTTWDEAVEHEIVATPVLIDDLLLFGSHTDDFRLAEYSDEEELRDEDGRVAGRIVRRRHPVSGVVVTEAFDLGSGLVKLRSEVANVTPVDDDLDASSSRDEVVRRSLVAVHIIASVDRARFISLLDPPDRAAGAVRECKNIGCFPVLCGSVSDDTILCSPIILYDHPEVAPESPGDMYDSTEIDEILALRTLTLTDEEKREARATDPRAAAIVDRVDAMSPDTFGRLHGAVRSLRTVVDEAPLVGRADRAGNLGEQPGENPAENPGESTVPIGRFEVGEGSRVRLHPRRGADAQDMFLVGRLATVMGVYPDFDGEVHIAVTVDDDPGAELNDWYGRFRYFRPEEIEVLEAGV